MTSGPRYKVSGRIFRASLATLIERDDSSRSGYDTEAVKRVAKQRGVTTQTVLRWRRGETEPSNRTKELTRRQALRAGRAQAIQVRTADGTFRAEGTIATSGSQNAVRGINRNLRRKRDAEIERARRSGSAAQMREARALPTRLTREEAADMALRRERLVDELGSGERPRTVEEGVFYEEEFQDSWESWREDYERQAG